MIFQQRKFWFACYGCLMRFYLPIYPCESRAAKNFVASRGVTFIVFVSSTASETNLYAVFLWICFHYTYSCF